MKSTATSMKSASFGADDSFGGACSGALLSKLKTGKRLFCALWVLSLWIFTPPGVNADILWFSSPASIGPIEWYRLSDLGGNTSAGFTSNETPVPKQFSERLEFPRFDPYFGALQETLIELSLNLQRQHFTEVLGCRFENDDPSPNARIFNRVRFVDGGFNWSPDPWSLPQLVPLGVNELPNSPATLGFDSMVCPSGVGTNIMIPDWCVNAKGSPDINLRSGMIAIPGPSPQYEGVGDWTLRLEADVGATWGFVREPENPCKAGATLEGSAEISGQAFVRGYYSFSPAVNVFVSDSVNHNVLRFRYDGSNVVREEFIAPGAGGLAYPSGLAFTPDGDLLVASYSETFPFGPSEIIRYEGQTGDFREAFAQHEQLTNPMSMIFGPDGDLYVLVQPNASLQRREAVLRFDGQTGEFMEVFATAPCGYLAPSCELDGAWDLAFGPFGDLYVTARVAEKVARFDGLTGDYKDIFIDGAEAVTDIVWPEGSASVFLQEGTQVKEYKIDPSTRDAVFFGYVTAASAIAHSGTALAMGPKMRLGATITTVPSLFSASSEGVFFFSPPRPRTANTVFSRGIGSASDVLVRPHVLQTVSRDIPTGDENWIGFNDAGLDVWIRFSEVSAGGTLRLAVSELAPGPDATGFEFLGTYYEFTVHDGLSYAGNVEICIEIPPGTDVGNAEILRWNGSSWESPISSSVSGNEICALFPSLSWFGIAVSAPSVVGDLDGDGDVDRDDLNILMAARNQPADNGDPRDLDGDGTITVLDARKLVLLCTRPRCATS